MFQDRFLLFQRCSFQQTKGGLFFPGCNLSIIMAGMEQVLSLPALIPTSVMTSLSVIQSNPQSCLLGALGVMALVLLSSPILPPPSPPLALKLPLLELLSCPNRYNLRRLPVLRWDGTLPLPIAVLRAEDKELSHDAPCHTRCRGSRGDFALAPERRPQRQRFKCVSYFLLRCWHQNVSNLSVLCAHGTTTHHPPPSNPETSKNTRAYTCIGTLT